MTIPVNKLSINVFQHETELKDKIFDGLQVLFPEEYHQSLEKLFREEKIEGYHGNRIIKYSSEFQKNKNTQNLFIFIMKKILASCSFYDLFDRITDSGELFIRLNKQDLISTGQLNLDSTSDVYKIVIKFLFFNKKIDKVKEIYSFLQTLQSE